jgi:hypothetical protein
LDTFNASSKFNIGVYIHRSSSRSTAQQILQFKLFKSLVRRAGLKFPAFSTRDECDTWAVETWTTDVEIHTYITYLNELDFRKPLVVSISKRSEEQRLYNLLLNLTISNPCFKAASK